MKRLLLFALPTTAAFGSLLPGIGAVFGFRLLVIFLGLLAFVTSKPPTKGIATVFAFRVTAVAWTATCLIWSFFVSDSDAGQRALLSLTIGLFLVYAFINARNPAEVLESIQRGWVAAYVITGALAFREFVTGTHMANYLPSSDLTVARASRLVASVFGNPNAYAAFLVTTFAFLAYGLLKSQAWYARCMYIAMILALLVLLLATGSRLCLIAVAVEVVFFAVYAGQDYRKPLAVGVSLVALVLFAVGAGAADSITSRLPGKLATVAPSQIVQEVLGGEAETSGSRRLAVYLDGLWMVGDSAGLGVGPGAFQTVMSSGRPPHDAGGVVDPHNLYLEIAA